MNTVLDFPLVGAGRTGHDGPLLDRFDITDAIITADALHTQRAHADYLLGRGAHYVLIVKGNQPSLHRQLASVPWKQVPAADTTTDKGQGQSQDLLRQGEVSNEVTK